MKVVRILHPWMPKYRVPFFEELINLGEKEGIQYQIFVGQTPPDSTGRKDSTAASTLFTTLDTRGIEFGGRSLIYHKIDSSWKDADLVIAEYAIRNVNTYRWLFFQRPKLVALWGHGRTYTKRNTKLEEWIKNQLVNRADWFFGYTQKGVETVVATGFPKTHTTVVQNSTDTSELQSKMGEVTRQKIEEFNNLYGISSGAVAVFIGALDSSKRLDFLIESAKVIQGEISDFHLLIFGEGPEYENVMKWTGGKEYIKVCGRADLEILAILSKVAQFIMMPGRVGLIAVDSFALGLPIVTTNWPWHAPEFEYLSNGMNAIITENDLATYSQAIISLIMNINELEQLQHQCRAEAINYTILNMASNFHAGVKNALQLSRHKKETDQ